MPLRPRPDRPPRRRVGGSTTTTTGGSRVVVIPPSDIGMPLGISYQILDFAHVFMPKEYYLKLLKGIEYDRWIPEAHDCDNQAAYGWVMAKQAWFKSPEFTARGDLAVGFATGRDCNGQAHAVVCFWTSPTELYFFDQTKWNVTKQGDGLLPFTPGFIIV